MAAGYRVRPRKTANNETQRIGHRREHELTSCVDAWIGQIEN